MLPFQKEILSDAFPEPTERGTPYAERSHSEILNGLGRGNAKSELAAAGALFELVMRESADIVVAAASYSQAALVFGSAASMVAGSPTLGEVLDVQSSQIVWRDHNVPGVMARTYSRAGTNEGGRPTLMIADELHEWNDEQKERLHLVLSTGLAKRKNTLCWNITTAGVSGRDTLCERKYQLGREHPEQILLRWWSADESLDIADEAQRVQALLQANPAARDGGFLGLSRLMARYHRMPESEFRRYHLNQWAATAQAWLPLGAWQKAADTKRGKPEPGTEIVLGFDGSYSRDSTALIGCTLDGHIFVLGAWERPLHDPDWRVPRHEVDWALEKAFDDYVVRELAYDPPGWHREAEDWVSRWGENIVVEFPTNVIKRMGDACSRFYVGVTNPPGSTQKLTHDGNPALARHIQNCEPKDTVHGTIITKAYSTSSRKIDLAVAAVVAWSRATRRQEEVYTGPLVF
ncbi:MAG TPA: terminase large subunit [Acidimicrobiales bacterium]|nr:terminase large subunit [Acidimicrobiales bacterium]